MENGIIKFIIVSQKNQRIWKYFFFKFHFVWSEDSLEERFISLSIYLQVRISHGPPCLPAVATYYSFDQMSPVLLLCTLVTAPCLVLSNTFISLSIHTHNNKTNKHLGTFLIVDISSPWIIMHIIKKQVLNDRGQKMESICKVFRNIHDIQAKQIKIYRWCKQTICEF